MEALLNSMFPPIFRDGVSPPRKTKFVTFAPGDDGTGLPDALYEHPDTFVRYKDPETGWVEDWGLFPEDDETQGIGQMQRTMRVQMLYWDTPRPETQFATALVEKKIERLKNIDVSKLRKQDYIMKIELRRIQNSQGGPRIWRRFRCSGGTSLFTFADKILHPIMGWVRNYHCYLFTDFKDGALFGPEKTDAVDMMHVGQHGWEYVKDTKYCIAHLLQEEGQRAGWIYDLGDNWSHALTVESILPEDESTGKVELIDGAGACPPEDSSGNHTWTEELEKWDKGKANQRREVLASVRQALNYKGKIKADWTPDTFDLAATRASLSQALSSSASVYVGTKKSILPMNGPVSNFFPPKAGERDVKFNREGMTYMEERVSENKDRPSVAVCASCGSPHNLKRCAGCHRLSYCGQECQKAHWKAHKRECKKAS